MVFNTLVGVLLDAISAFRTEEPVGSSGLHKTHEHMICCREKVTPHRSTSGETMGVINLSNPDQGIVFKITSSTPLKGHEITSGLLHASTNSRQLKHDANKCVRQVIKLVLRAQDRQSGIHELLRRYFRRAGRHRTENDLDSRALQYDFL